MAVTVFRDVTQHIAPETEIASDFGMNRNATWV